MSNKGYLKHKCKKCGTPRSTSGDYCQKCIADHLATLNQSGFNFWDNLTVSPKAAKAMESPDIYCVVCGRKVSDNAQVIEIGVDGYEFGTTGETESQGGFLIGSECAKRVAHA